MIALLASWESQWIEEHRRMLRTLGQHLDGWSNAIREDKVRKLYASQKKLGYLWFYAYMSARGGGNKKVCHRLKIQDLRYIREKEFFNHPCDAQGPANVSYEARLIFKVVDIEDITPNIDVETFVTVDETRVTKGSMLLNVLVVHDIGSHEISRTR